MAGLCNRACKRVPNSDIGAFETLKKFTDTNSEFLFKHGNSRLCDRVKVMTFR